ncbi:hypothetical protein [Mycobacteroides abscessus]|uniref:hypothetical protein n=1 Tax=Mycobacteroides abscessus TaxID=36809 RepID=UPI001F1A831F|nr:hypothetical protein [Mycobacteroides abscessus]
MPENPTIRASLMGLAELFDEPNRLTAPDAEHCSAADRPEEWTELSLGWSRVLGAARTIQGRHKLDSEDDVLSMCADASREASLGELRWVWARLVTKYVEGMSADA